MNLPDFTDFPPLLALRKKMGATELGQFDFFDPVLHLTGEERIQLAGPGIAVGTMALRKLLDHTVAYKNARVIVWQPQCAEYHLCWCKNFPQLPDVFVGARKPAGMSVCSECLDHLQYDGHNSHRHRHQDYYAQVRKHFDVATFFQRFPHYPIGR